MDKTFDSWADDIAANRASVDTFARSAIGDIPKVETHVRPPMNASVWAPEELAKMQRIWRGEEDGNG